MHNNHSHGNRSEKGNCVVKIPADKPLDFENITVDLFSTTPEEYAKICAKEQVIGGKPVKDANKGTQLRRFYDELVMWTERSETDEKFKENLPFIYMMKSKVSYALGRKHIDENYRNMMVAVINGVKENNPKTLKNAKLFLEAFMGFFKELKPKD